jgi:hypothetical protein
MDAKFFFGILGLIGFCGGCYAFIINQDLDSLNVKLMLTRQSVASVQTQIDNISRQLDQRREVSQLIQTSEASKAETEALEKEIQGIQDAEPALADSLNQAISRIRRESVGLEFPELTLVGGAILKKVQIQRVEENEVILKHSEGVKRANAGELPANLKDRFRLGALAKLAPAPAVTAPTTSPSVAAQDEAQKKYEKKLLDARLATERMRKELEAVKAQLTQAESDMAAATSATKKFYSKARRDQISLQTQAMQSRVTNAEIELQRIEASPPKAPN